MWECLQTISLSGTKYIAEIDRTSSYLVLSSLETRCCYVLQIVNNNQNNANVSSSSNKDSDEADGKETSICKTTDTIVASAKTNNVKNSIAVYIKSIAEFPLSSGILSFSIVDAAVRRYKCGNDNYLCDELDDYDEETNSIYCVVIRMFIVQSKSMQDCHILYQPSVTENTDVKSTLSSNVSGQLLDSMNSSITENSSTLPIVKNSCSVTSSDNSGEDASRNSSITNSSNADKKQEKNSSIDSNPLQAFFNMALDSVNSSGSAASGIQISVQSSNTTSTTTVISAPSTGQDEKSGGISPRNDVSPHQISSGYSQSVNLMTPDAFSSSATGNIIY